MSRGNWHAEATVEIPVVSEPVEKGTSALRLGKELQPTPLAIWHTNASINPVSWSISEVSVGPTLLFGCIACKPSLRGFSPSRGDRTKPARNPNVSLARPSRVTGAATLQRASAALPPGGPRRHRSRPERGVCSRRWEPKTSAQRIRPPCPRHRPPVGAKTGSPHFPPSSHRNGLPFGIPGMFRGHD